MSFRNNILISHICIWKTYPRFTMTSTDYRCISSCQTGTEKSWSIVWNNQIRTWYPIKISQHVISICFWSPTRIGIWYCINTICTIATHTIYLLNIIPLRQLCINSQSSIIFYTEFFFPIRFLCGNKDNSMARTATIQGWSSRTFQDRNIFNIIWVNTRNAITQIISAISSSTSIIRIIQRYPINHI